jgi:peptidoglycan/xylan/chitin deacetylase (PgdA/CDA1 family)
VILLYHGVTADRDDGFVNFDGKHVHVDLFRQHLNMIRRRRRVIPLNELIDGLRAGSELKGAIAITFDDGYLDNYEHAAGALAEYKLAASFFLATGFIGANRWAWVDRLEAAFAAAGVGPFSISLLGDMVTLTESISQRARLLARIKVLLKTLPPEIAELRAQEIEAELRIDLHQPFGLYRFMSWDNVRRLSEAGFEIGAHTVNHTLLSRMPITTAQQEIMFSREKIVAETGFCSPTFCYPNGKRADYTVVVMDFCRQHFTSALSAEAGAARLPELYELRRVIVDGATTTERLAGMILRAE